MHARGKQRPRWTITGAQETYARSAATEAAGAFHALIQCRYHCANRPEEEVDGLDTLFGILRYFMVRMQAFFRALVRVDY